MMMADYPTGANEVKLADKVAAIIPLGDGEIDKGIAFFDTVLAGKGTYKYMKDRTKTTPADVITVVGGIAGTLGTTRDLRYVYYFKDADMDTGYTDGYIAHMDGSDMKAGKAGGCVLTDQLNSDQYGAPFSLNGSQVFWVSNIDDVDGVGQAWTAVPEGCANPHQFTDKVDFWFLHGNDGMVFSDEGALRYSTLKYLTFSNAGTSIGPAVTVQKQVNRVYGIVGNFDGLIFNIVNSDADKDGLYLYAKVPFAGPVNADGGVTVPHDAGAAPDVARDTRR
jgi:hypothetical protein